ncbi:hypothetical protein QQY66_29370 [Streptomyces sp. DG2A-72]|uniref:hypothetical protein n=1 Tax=Streptomyces sp. DG2A-72 TaxID=3051386 RepID=UPI00265BDB75|nr:hypothetical protein [Streptomyces sp. DG2A-72]MDO0935583.1 hypothetical protein [Streptomyces sp. DG2A-72]
MKRTTAHCLALTIALTAAAGCTSSDGPDEDDGDRRKPPRALLAALRSVERSTDGADSAKVESTTVMGTELSLEADGALGWGDGLTGTLTITYTGGTTAETMRDLGVTSMEARYLPDAYYARMGDTFAEQTGGKHWIRYAYDDLDDLGGGAAANFADQMRSAAPNQSVKLLLASADVHKIGEEKVRGKHTTHYSGTVAVGDLADAELKELLQQAGVTTQTVDIWVDDQDLLIKKTEQGRLATGHLTQTAYYSDYGVQVTAAEPPASDTEDFRELLKKQGGSAS